MRIYSALRLVILCIFLTSCRFGNSGNGGSGNTDSQNIFTADTDPVRRHQATFEERLWTISMGGCTGHLLAPDVMMTAAHCQATFASRMTSGSAINNNGPADISVTNVLELNKALDYAILGINWVSGAMPVNMKFPSRIATKQSDVNFSVVAGQGDEVFTVGFPADKNSRLPTDWGATYSQGRLKNVQTLTNKLTGAIKPVLYYDMGIINGNSGGGVWRKSDGMLVSLTNDGSKAYQDAGWNTSSVTNPDDWNHGVAMWIAYAASPKLQEIFPGGVNKNGGAGGIGGGSAPPAGNNANPVPNPAPNPDGNGAPAPDNGAKPTQAPTPVPTPTLPPIDPDITTVNWQQIPIGVLRFEKLVVRNYAAEEGAETQQSE